MVPASSIRRSQKPVKSGLRVLEARSTGEQRARNDIEKMFAHAREQIVQPIKTHR
jgi:hypothetical protein